jgi:Ca2+-binding RTX toxin-like protein
VLTGNGGINVLNGGAGADSMAGGAGSDVYIVDNTGDTVTELAGGGTDQVRSFITYALGADVERLALAGNAEIDGAGNALDNRITGNTAANLLDGGEGKDTIVGGAGNETLAGGAGNDGLDAGHGNDMMTSGAGADGFHFHAPPGATDADVVSDFVSGEDRIFLDHLAFTEIGAPGAFAAGDARFFSGAGATSGADADDRIVYDTGTGELYYDADGSGAGASLVFGTLQGAPALTAADFSVL